MQCSIQDMLTVGMRTKAKSWVQHSQMFKDSACCMYVSLCLCVCFVCILLCIYYLYGYFLFAIFCVCTFVFVFVHVCNVCVPVCTCVLYTSMYMFACDCVWLHLVEDVVKLSVLPDLVKGLPQLIQWNIWKIGTVSQHPIYRVIARCNSFITDRINNFYYL